MRGGNQSLLNKRISTSSVCATSSLDSSRRVLASTHSKNSRKARRLGKPCFIYVRQTTVAEQEPELVALLLELDHPRTGLVIRRFEDNEQLAAGVRDDVLRWLRALALESLDGTSGGAAPTARSGGGRELYLADLCRLLQRRVEVGLEQAWREVDEVHDRPSGRLQLFVPWVWWRVCAAAAAGIGVVLLSLLLADFFGLEDYQRGDRSSSYFIGIPLTLAVTGFVLGGVSFAVTKIATLFRRSRFSFGFVGRKESWLFGSFELTLLELDGTERRVVSRRRWCARVPDSSLARVEFLNRPMGDENDAVLALSVIPMNEHRSS